MDLRPRQRQTFNGFTKSEGEGFGTGYCGHKLPVLKLEQLLNEFKEQSPEDEFCKKLARGFNRSSGRAGKPVVKWTEIQSWFEKNQQQALFKAVDVAKKSPIAPDALILSKATGNSRMPEGEKGEDLSGLEFEARSSADGAWYDVDKFLSHRILSSGEAEVRVRYVGFGAEEDEWVKLESVRERSVPLEHSECGKVKVGDLVVCFQEKQDQARYFDAHVIEIQRRLHDIRGCRCLFLIRYDHDNTEETVRLRRLCCRPNILRKV